MVLFEPGAGGGTLVPCSHVGMGAPGPPSLAGSFPPGKEEKGRGRQEGKTQDYEIKCRQGQGRGNRV